MKKSFMFAMMSAIALAGTVGLSGCTDSDDVANNPNYDPQTGGVTVDFVFNVSTSNEPTTRMTSANTQAAITDPFRGITNAYLCTYKLANDGKFVTDPTSVADMLHSLGPVIGAGKLNPNADASGDVTKSHRVLQLSLESGTNSLLFYGKAIKDGTDLEQGKITMNIDKTPSNTSISMCKIVPETAYENTPGIYQAKFQQYQKFIAAVLTSIINAGVASAEITFGAETRPLTLNWKDYATVTGESGSYVLSKPAKDPFDNTKNLSLLGERLASTFVTLNTIHTSELRAGCGQAVSDMISDVMANINQVISATPLNIEEVAAQEVAKAIKSRVDTFFVQSEDYAWKTKASDFKTKATFVLDADKTLIDDNSNFNNFPADFNLPLGAVILELAIKADATRYAYTYNYQGTVETYAMGGGTSGFDPKNYYYPAELCYFGNSPIRVTNETKVEKDYPDGVGNWENNNSWATGNWTNNSHVTSSTRSVAMRDNINYGTALLKSTVRYGAKTLQDNNHNLQYTWSGNVVDEPNNTIDVSERDNHFVLTGVLVGGQDPEVGWNYIAKGTSTGFGAMVYDKADGMNIPKATADAGGNPSDPMYTLVWDNWDATFSGQKQRDVYIALEFKNNSKNFYGENNLIRNDATFYLIGKLDPDKIKKSATEYYTAEEANDRSLGITWPTNYALPPYNGDATIQQRRVFIQDYMTEATFVIGPTSLQHALVAVPDLRSGQVSLGLSVDLQWQTGLNFGDVILGE